MQSQTKSAPGARRKAPTTLPRNEHAAAANAFPLLRGHRSLANLA
ncbi:hypothetical protein BN2475_270005 [Paraburkholderia ribeironis]|uniref:Uncharacterized protein n=1 Tax=Paraburkholderia ribeironis TaxID=1247936 RepID=A0A1N7S0W4_9BURK|nr:hypothetical protein BN2475_270005 [Paraburkholderia ribeironis]